jgi:hypothetical protein
MKWVFLDLGMLVWDGNVVHDTLCFFFTTTVAVLALLCFPIFSLNIVHVQLPYQLLRRQMHLLRDSIRKRWEDEGAN